MAHPFLLPPQRWKRTPRTIKILTGSLVSVLLWPLRMPTRKFQEWCDGHEDDPGATVVFVACISLIVLLFAMMLPGIMNQMRNGPHP